MNLASLQRICWCCGGCSPAGVIPWRIAEEETADI